MEKGLRLKVRTFWGLIPTFVEVTGEKLEGGLFCPPSSSWIGLKCYICGKRILRKLSKSINIDKYKDHWHYTGNYRGAVIIFVI